MKERLQKILSARGLASRRQAEQWIAAGRLTVNGAVAQLGDGADPETDEILLDGKPLPKGERLVYLMLNKPRGYVTTLHDEQGRPNAAQLVADCGVRVYPVGRLDMNSEGLLLFTNDGEFANALMHPKHQVEKTYRVTVRSFSQEGLERLSRPVALDGYTIRKPSLRLLKAGPGDRAELEIVIHEGRNRQIRRMCDLAGMPVCRLLRIAEGCVRLGTLPRGRWRYLTEDELAGLRQA